jgi:cytochrome c-type biogenesis protein CcmH
VVSRLPRHRGRRWHAGIVAVLLAVSAYAAAQGAIEAFAFDDASQEVRYRALTEEFRCPKCLNTNLAGSDSPIAADLRATVHRLILEGASDQDIRDYLQARYGDFVLYNPPMRRDTMLLWVAPAALIAIGLVVIAVMVLRRRGSAEALTDAERLRLEQLLRDAAQPSAPDLPKDSR